MDTLRILFEEYGLLLVFGAVLVEQVGPPFPSGPLLIVAGVLANEGRLSAWPVAAVAWGAGMLGKVALYVVGSR
jgi:membrane protein DedA with SNARE-associated domain